MAPRQNKKRRRKCIVTHWKAHRAPFVNRDRCSRNDFHVQSGGHWLEVLRPFLESAFKLRRDVGVEGIIRRVGGQRPITPMFVHPKPWRWIRSHKRLELVPASLRDFLKGCVRWKLNPRMKNNPVTPPRQ